MLLALDDAPYKRALSVICGLFDFSPGTTWPPLWTVLLLPAWRQWWLVCSNLYPAGTKTVRPQFV
jgi:hypothetical protein